MFQWPEAVNAGRDPQLEKAIELALEGLEKEQIDALERWVRFGGRLILCVGQRGEKVQLMPGLERRNLPPLDEVSNMPEAGLPAGGGAPDDTDGEPQR